MFFFEELKAVLLLLDASLLLVDADHVFGTRYVDAELFAHGTHARAKVDDLEDDYLSELVVDLCVPLAPLASNARAGLVQRIILARQSKLVGCFLRLETDREFCFFSVHKV